MTDATVRLARTSDLDDVAAVQVAAWRADYAGVLPDSVLAALDPGDIALTWARGLLASGAQRLFVALGAQDSVIGYAGVGPSSDPDATEEVGELHALEVDPRHRRNGHGSRLLHASMDLLGQSGCTSAVTWVLLDDEVRRRFLTEAGWGPDSAFRDLEVDDGRPLRQVRLVTSLVDQDD